MPELCDEIRAFMILVLLVQQEIYHLGRHLVQSRTSKAIWSSLDDMVIYCVD